MNINTSDYAVYVENVCKSYGDANPILRNACMKIKKGTVHALLGSSGSGKTTMLSCIVGFEKWESGTVLVFGKTPGAAGSEILRRKLGYMPQEFALYRYLTIREIIYCFGQLHNMKISEIDDMRNHLFELLDLPGLPTLIKDLSGGQKRRVSLALAMLHSPELLVLDEPTAGVDPLLRKSIWDHLYELVDKTGVTVLITTHYIEEARHANMIGVMRNGRLLVEKSPSSILESCRCELLENAVLQICQKDESKLSSSTLPSYSTHHQSDIKFKTSSRKSPFYNNMKNNLWDKEESLEGKFQKADGFDWEPNHKNSYRDCKFDRRKTGWLQSIFECNQRVYGFSVAIILTYIRNPIYILLILLMPTFQGGLTLSALGSKPHKLHLGIVNKEIKNWTTECESPVNLGNSCQLKFFSCHYINELRKDDLLILDAYNTELDALSQVKLGKSWGLLAFPEKFSESSRDLVTYKQFAMNESIEGSRIQVRLDHSGYVQVSLIIKKLIISYMSFARNVADFCHFDIQLNDIPLNFQSPVYGTNEDDFSGYVLPGVVLISIFGIGFGVTSLAHVSDRKDGTLTRAYFAGLTAPDIIISHFISQMIVAVAQLVIWNVMLIYIFSFVNLGSTWLWIVICILVEMSGVACGLLLGQLCGNQLQVLYFCMFLYTIFVFFGCLFIPVERMSKVWQNVAHLLPTFLPSSSARSVLVRGVGITHPLVWPGLVLSVLWIIVVSAIVFILIKRSYK